MGLVENQLYTTFFWGTQDKETFRTGLSVSGGVPIQPLQSIEKQIYATDFADSAEWNSINMVIINNNYRGKRLTLC